MSTSRDAQQPSGFTPLRPPEGRRPRVLLVYKRSLYELYVEEHRDDRIMELLAGGDATVESLRHAHERHTDGLRQAMAAFQDAAVDLETCYRGDLERIDAEVDLLVVVGGDGTLLDASHHVAQTPLLGINSDPVSSVGFLCSEVAANTASLVRHYLEGALGLRPLNRLEVRKDGRRLGPLALNDVLVTHTCPAAASKYTLTFGSTSEKQVSSGIWISTAAGSTAAIHSAGGQRVALSDARIQFVVRELYEPPGRRHEIRGGFVPPGQVLELAPRMRTGMLYFDGAHVTEPITYGETITFGVSESPLRQVVAPSA